MDYGKDKQPGDDMPCPLCRKEFTIPADGLSGIPKNFIMEKLVSARKLSAGEEAGHILRDVCSSDEAKPSKAKPVTKQCLLGVENLVGIFAEGMWNSLIIA